MVMWRALVRLIPFVMFSWAMFAALSLLSELKFLVDGLGWSITHVAISFKAILLEIGKRVSEVVAGYREFVHGLAQLLHLPRFAQYVYDILGVASFSTSKGIALMWRDVQLAVKAGKDQKVKESALSHFVMETILLFPAFAQKSPTFFALAMTLLYVGTVAAAVSSLFGIDWLYRHFA
jgi:hypothetical protein